MIHLHGAAVSRSGGGGGGGCWQRWTYSSIYSRIIKTFTVVWFYMMNNSIVNAHGYVILIVCTADSNGAINYFCQKQWVSK